MEVRWGPGEGVRRQIAGSGSRCQSRMGVRNRQERNAEEGVPEPLVQQVLQYLPQEADICVWH